MNKLNSLLKKELLSSMGCTEPSAIAYAAAWSKEHLPSDEPINKITLKASSNIIKNALCVNIPNTKVSGIEMILLLGISNCRSKDKLTILNNISPTDIETASKLSQNISIDIEIEPNVDALYIEVELQTENHIVKTTVEHEHDHISRYSIDGEEHVLSEEYHNDEFDKLSFSFDDIYDFVISNQFDHDLMRHVKETNYQLGLYGLENSVGLNVGKTIASSDLYSEKYKRIIASTVAGIDSRMSGVPKKVIINSGSGNQGLTATIPIVEFCQLYEVPEDKELAALAFSHLVTLYIRNNQNRLSSSCGAVCASAGVAAGIAYLMNCNKEQIEGAIINLLCSNFGVFCDGAKVTCSLKVSSSIASALNSAILAKDNIFLNENLGVISPSLDKTLKILSVIEHELTQKLDSVIMKEAIKNARGMSYSKTVKYDQ